MSEIIDGAEYSLREIDAQLRELIPEIGRRCCTPRVMAEADYLLDQRNEVLAIQAYMQLMDGIEDKRLVKEFSRVFGGGY